MTKYWLFTFSKKEETFKENGLKDFMTWLINGMTGQDEQGMYFAFNQKNQSISEGDRAIFAFTDADKDPEHRWLLAIVSLTSGAIDYDKDGYSCKYYCTRDLVGEWSHLHKTEDVVIGGKSITKWDEDFMENQSIEDWSEDKCRDSAFRVMEFESQDRFGRTETINSSYISQRMNQFPMEITGISKGLDVNTIFGDLYGYILCGKCLYFMHLQGEPPLWEKLAEQDSMMEGMDELTDDDIADRDAFLTQEHKSGEWSEADEETERDSDYSENPDEEKTYEEKQQK